MNIKKYEAFIRAVELGSLSKAAEELGYTQSGISHMMQSLEEEVGFPLLVRTSSGILPNAEGETLLPAIRRLLRTNDALAQTIAQIKGADSGRVRVIAFSSAAACWLPEVICRFQRDFPHVEVMLREADGDTIDAVMEAHEADLCLDAGGATRSVEWLPLCRDQLMAVLPKGHRLARERAVSLEALQQERLLLPLKGYGRAAHQMAGPAFRKPGGPVYRLLGLYHPFHGGSGTGNFHPAGTAAGNTPRTALYRFRWSRPSTGRWAWGCRAGTPRRRRFGILRPMCRLMSGN